MDARMLREFYTSSASYQSRGFLLPHQQEHIAWCEAQAAAYFKIARRMMQPITIEELKSKPASKSYHIVHEVNL